VDDEPQGSSLLTMPPEAPQKPNFWFQAYLKCYEKEETKELMDGMKRILGIDPCIAPGGPPEKALLSESEFVGFNKSMESRLRDNVKELEDHKWKVPLNKGEMEVVEVVEKFVDVIALAQNFVGTALASNPSGAFMLKSGSFSRTQLKARRPSFRLLRSLRALCSVSWLSKTPTVLRTKPRTWRARLLSCISAFLCFRPVPYGIWIIAWPGQF
jgi:hypothetical protein